MRYSYILYLRFALIPFIFRFFVPSFFSIHPVTVSLSFSQYNGVLSTSSALIVFFRCFYWFTHCPRVGPLVRIAPYIGSTFLSDHIIAIYIIIIFIPAQWRRFVVTIVDCYILKFFYDSSSWMTATTHWVC